MCLYFMRLSEGELVTHPEVIGKVHHIQDQLNERSVVIKIVKIRGHSGIKGNERADREARQAVQKIVNGKIKAPVCVSVADADAYKISAEIAKKSWQRRWDSDSKVRHTHELIPEVGTRICWPRKRDIGMSYCRMLLHDTMLNDDAFRTGVAVTHL